MTEAGVWAYLKKGMQGKWLATRVESSAGNGFPDVHFVINGKHGFIETKYIKEWPKREITKVKLPLRPEQKLWIESRGKVAGRIWVFVRIENEFFLIPSTGALQACEGFNRNEYVVASDYHATGQVDFDRLARWIC